MITYQNAPLFAQRLFAIIIIELNQILKRFYIGSIQSKVSKKSSLSRVFNVFNLCFFSVISIRIYV